MAQLPAALSQEQCAFLIESFEAALASEGYELYSSAQKLKVWLDSRYPMVVAAQSRESLQTYLSGLTVKDAGEVTNGGLMLAAIPKLASAALNQSIRQAAKKSPARSGPPLKTTPDLRGEVIRQVSTLYSRGIAMGAAQLRAAQNCGLSKRSVQRIWQARKEFADQPFQSLGDIWEFIQKL